MALQPGMRVGPYEILSPLGAGGMGEVYRARDSKLGREVAIKALPQAFVSDHERVGRFQREAQLLAALNHPHIASVFGLEDSGETRLLVMELVEGESLAERLRAGTLPADEAVDIARQIGDALAVAHDKGIVHRDLKPGNIMLTREGRVKVLDFGLAKMLETEAAVSGISMSPTLSVQATLAGTILGTAAYMSPEQARGRAVDKRTDIWAFGCVLFEMLTARRAFEGDDTTETIAAVVRGEPDWKALPADLPPRLRRAIEGCLVKDQRQRFADIAVPLFLIDDEPAAPPGMPPSLQPQPRWRRVTAFGAVAVLAAAAAGGLVWWLRPSPPPPLVSRFVLALPADQVFTNTGRRVLALSSDGSRLVYVANQRLYGRAIGDLEPREIAGSALGGAIVGPVFSPDGREVAFFSNLDATLKRISVTGGPAVTIAGSSNPLGMSWGTDGIVYGQAAGIMRVDSNGGRPEVLAKVGADESASMPQSLPDGRGVLFSVRKFASSWDTGRVVVKTPGGELKTIIPTGAGAVYLPTGHIVYAISGVLMAVPFDLDRLEVTGGAVPVVEGVSRAPLAGGNASSGAAHASIAANGTLAYVPGPPRVGMDAGDRVLAVFDANGGVEPLKMPPGFFLAPRVSRDGRRVAYENSDDAGSGIWIFDLGGGSAPRRLTFGGSNRAPIVSPDGVWVAFQSNREGDFAIFRQRADGSGAAERLTKPEMGAVHVPQSWSPDGAHLLFSIEKDQTFTLWTRAMKDGQETRFGTVTSAISPEAAFSPDGRWVAYQARESRTGGVVQSFVEPFPATGAKYLVPQNGGHPRWTAMGDGLILNIAPTQNRAVGVTTTPGIAFSTPEDWPRRGRVEPNPSTGRRNADMLPDGRMLGVGTMTSGIGTLSAGSASGERIVIVLNWFDDLKARVPAN